MTMKTTPSLLRLLPLLLVLAVVASGAASAQQVTEAFDSGVPGTWLTVNNSSPLGTTGWFAGNSGVFTAQAGAGYVAANFNNTTDGGTISDWLISPQLTNLQNGEVLSFYTRTEAGSNFPDLLEVRLCVGDTTVCSNVGSTAASVGNFTTLLQTINPTLAVGSYPTTWTSYNMTLSGLPVGVNPGRFAFRYAVPNAGPGPTAVNSDYIGIDTVGLTGPPPVDLAITKTVDNPAPAVLGLTVSFTLTVTNSGALPATNVTVNDLLPAGLQFVSATASQGSYSSATGIWAVGTVDNAAPRTLTIRANVNAAGLITNTATVATADQVDANATNNTASVTVNASSSAVPALGNLGLLAFGLLLGLGGLLFLRRGV